MKIVKFVPIAAVIAFVVLVILLQIHKERSVPQTRWFVAKTNLQPLTLVNAANLEPHPDPKSPLDITKLSDRYLLVGVDKDKEVRDEMLAPQAATALLSDAMAVSIAAGPTTVVGNQLRAGDLVDVVAAPLLPVAAGDCKRKFENLMVLTPATATNSTVVLAVPSAQRDCFAAALVGTQLLVSRKIIAIKP